MEYTDKPVWTFYPNWDNGVLERLEWVTDVLTSSTGAEQRISKRLSPRRSFEVSFALGYQDRQYFDNMMSRYVSREWLIPLWHDVTKTTEDTAVGADMIPVDTTLREYMSGGYVLLRGPSARKFEVAQIQEIEPDGLKLISNNIQAWPAGTKVYPLRAGRIDAIDQGFTITKQTDVFTTSELTITLTEANDYAATYDLEPLMYNGVGVISLRPDESDDRTFTYLSLLQTLDGTSGFREYFDPGGQMFIQQQYAWAVSGREQNAKLRRLFYVLAGRLNSMWLPTFMQDFDIVRDIDAGDQAITVRNTGFAATGALAQAGKQDIRIEFRDGTSIMTKILAATELDDDREVIGLADAFPVSVPASFVRSISFMVIARMDSDTIEINHDTDVDGLSRVVTSWRSTPVEREAEDWDPPPFPDAIMNAIQVYCSCNCSPFDTMSYLDTRISLMPATSSNRHTWGTWYDSLPSDIKASTASAINGSIDSSDGPSLYNTASLLFTGVFLGGWFTPAEQAKDWFAYFMNYSDPPDTSTYVSYQDSVARNTMLNALRDPSGNAIAPPTRQSLGVPDSPSGILSEACAQIMETDLESSSDTVPGHISQFRGAAAALYGSLSAAVNLCNASTTGWPTIPVAGQFEDPGAAAAVMANRLALNPDAETIRPKTGAHLILFYEGHDSSQAFGSGGQTYYGPRYSGTIPQPNPSAGFGETWVHASFGVWIDDAPWPSRVTVEVATTSGTVIGSQEYRTGSTQMADGRYLIAALWLDTDFPQNSTGYFANPKLGQFSIIQTVGDTIIVRVRS